MHPSRLDSFSFSVCLERKKRVHSQLNIRVDTQVLGGKEERQFLLFLRLASVVVLYS